VDDSTESAAALRWACREAALRGAEVHAVHAREAPVHSMASYASYAVRAEARPREVDVAGLWRSVMPGLAPDVRVRTEVANGLAARVLLERCEGAEMLVLGTAGDRPAAPGASGSAGAQGVSSGSARSAGPVIRACLLRAPCPVVVISAAREPLAPRDEVAVAAGLRIPVPVPAGAWS
jgi:nucleotide-binding universal stress UspA family protein